MLCGLFYCLSVKGVWLIFTQMVRTLSVPSCWFVGLLTHCAGVSELHVPRDVFTFLRCWFAVSVGGGYRGFAQFF